MPNEYNQIWIEKIFKKIPIPYPILSLFIAVIIYSVYWFFSTKIYYFPWDFVDRLVVSALAILIALQLVGIQYVLNKIKRKFIGLLLFPNNVKSIGDLYTEFENRFYRSYWYYVLVALVIVPFIIFFIQNILQGGKTYYTSEPTAWSFLCDIYNNVVGFSMLYLLAIILWIIFNIAWTFIDIGSDRYRHLIEINIFNIDKIGGLKPLRNFILLFLAYYFICITLAIISYISPERIFSYESFFLIILLILGVCFFLLGLRTIQKIVKGKIEFEIDKISERYQKEHQRLMEILSEENYEDKEKELNLVSRAMEILNDERERRIQLYDKAKGYDFITVIQFASSFIPPLIAFLQKFIPLEAYFIAYLNKLIHLGIIGG